MDIMRTSNFSAPDPRHPFDAPRPDDDLPISAQAWDAAKDTGGDARFLLPILFEAIKVLEAELTASRMK
ncbi:MULTISPECIES: hypothetical protein [Mycobacterium]|uniref:hypothetical protein n=1 Tax=Mycobacterium TaxID=1763 RepID=UPI0002ABAA60|nr:MULTISPECIES: hypothetical protein [Mycobacterium]ELR85691.1 hypothetical protein W7U_10745 [Mycobacterium sp. H4Y]